MGVSRCALGVAVVLGVGVCAPAAIAASPDGVRLTLSDQWPSIALQWTGSAGPYDVHRSTLAATVTGAAERIATTGENTFVDTPPPGGIHFYVVTAGCPAGSVACGSGCSDLSSDSVHCGACGVACQGGQTCVSGACACPAGEASCFSGCATLADDEQNCGACGIACGAGASCVSGACVCTGACSNQRPDANAGPDQPNVVDVDTSGIEHVTLDGSSSRDPDGMLWYEWREGFTTLASGSIPTTQVPLALGAHTITLTVTDDQGAADVDDVVITVTPGSSAHPKLVIRGNAFQEMRDRAAAEPWASMRTDAIVTSNAGYLGGSGNGEVARNLTDFSSASALAYILDEPNARLYATRVRDAILNYTDALTFGTDWGTVVPPANALFNLTLALDVVFNHLTADEVTAAETKMQDKVNRIWTGDWASAGLGAIGTWNVYKGTRTTPDNAYYDSLMSGLSLDGVFLGGRCYGWARWNGANRYVKNMYMDVLEHTGIDPRYYQNPRVVGLYEWLYGQSNAVFGGPIPFGDCAIEAARASTFDEPPLYRAGKFGLKAAQYASLLLPPEIAGNLLSYVLPDGPLPPGAYPTSKLYPDGGGFFMEAIASEAERPAAVAGSVWNAKEVGDHSHYEANAIALYGYNEYLLVNSGYAGWGYAPPGYSWTWVHDDDRSGNTLRSSRHASKLGGGIVEGFTDTLFDYASGDDGPALSDDVHVRNFIFVHSADSKGAYFVLFDEVSAESGELIFMNLHPNTLATTGIQTVLAGTEFMASIDAIAAVPGRAKLTVFYATPPNTVRHMNGGVATWDAVDGGFNGRYLESEYTTPANGQKNLVTILFPHDPAHAKATLSRLSISGSTGATIDLGSGIVDTALESSGAAPVTQGSDTFTGRALLSRRNAAGANVFYFVRKGTLFTTSSGPAVGYSSAAPVSVHLRGTQGRIAAATATRVRFNYPLITGVRLDGSPVAIAASGSGWVEIDVPSGTHAVLLLTGNQDS